MSWCRGCGGKGVYMGRYCNCAVGKALRAAPSVRIGDTVLAFPPGTTMEHAREAMALALEKLKDMGD